MTTRYELSVEAAALVLLLALYAQWRQRPSRQVLSWLAVVLMVWVLGRYAEITAPVLYGRPVNLFWDVRHLPGVVAMLVEAAPWWHVILALASAASLLALVFLMLRWILVVTADVLVESLPRHVVIGLSSAVLALYATAQLGSHEQTRRWFSVPVTATYVQQLSLLYEALVNEDATLRVDAQPLPTSGLERLSAADVIVVFLESYGAVAFDRPGYAHALKNSRTALANALQRSGRHAVSAFVRSPTFGGASWLAHSSFLSGIEVTDNRMYERLLTGKRETLVQRFASHGYRTLALMPGLRYDWPEGGFYGFDKIYDAKALEYRGPEFGWWRIPDQYALARLDTLELAADERAPVMLFFTTISSHAPFRPTPPYRSDWQALLGPEPFGPDGAAAQLNTPPQWLDLGSAYVDSLNYAMTYIASYVETQARAELVLMIIGDHQPPAGVSGPDASWDVPVHVIASHPEIIDTLRAEGFEAGLTPSRPVISPMHELTAKLLLVFDSAARPDTPVESTKSGLGIQSRVDIARSGPQGKIFNKAADLVRVAPVAAHEPVTLPD